MSQTDCPCETNQDTSNSSKEEETLDKECPPLGVHSYTSPETTAPEQQALPVRIRQPQNPYSSICPSCSITRNVPVSIRCSIPPRNEANRQGVQKCRDLSSCVPQTSDQLVIYNTTCPMISKGKTAPSARMTTITKFVLDGPPQYIQGSTPAIAPFPPIIIPQVIQWNTTFNEGSFPFDLRDVTNRSFNSGWIDSEYFRIATPGTYTINFKILFVGVGTILAFFFSVAEILTKVAIFIQFYEEDLDLDNPYTLGEAPAVYINTTMTVEKPVTFRYWIVTLIPGLIVPSLTISKINESAGTSVEHLNVTRGPYYNNST